MHLHEDGLAWYALHVRQRFEKVVAGMLRGKGYEEFLPLYRRESRWSDRIKQIELPLFPGYVFSKFDLSNRLHILTIPGVNAVVGFGKKIIPIDESELDTVRNLLKSGKLCEPTSFIAVGNRVRVEYGPLEGAEGFVTYLKNEFRLVISINMLQRSVAVEIDRDCLKAIPEQAAAQAAGAAKHRKREMLVS